MLAGMFLTNQIYIYAYLSLMNLFTEKLQKSVYHLKQHLAVTDVDKYFKIHQQCKVFIKIPIVSILQDILNICCTFHMGYGPTHFTRGGEK